MRNTKTLIELIKLELQSCQGMVEAIRSGKKAFDDGAEAEDYLRVLLLRVENVTEHLRRLTRETLEKGGKNE